MQYHVLYNPLAGNGKGESAARALANDLPADSFTFEDVTAITDFAALFARSKSAAISTTLPPAAATSFSTTWRKSRAESRSC